MAVLVRIFLREGDELGGKPLYSVILSVLKSKGIRGATVLKAILGYGTTGEYHYEGIEILSYDLPVVVEFVDEEEKVQSVLEEVSKYLKSGLITMEKAEIWC
jgi:PII-like signaling protein